MGSHEPGRLCRTFALVRGQTTAVCFMRLTAHKASGPFLFPLKTWSKTGEIK